ncbi:predicted protein [Sclerotinia sclerotiorum 1980 UF-70]|uniref:Uncharacterized protein n=1 Tax=Sclerotinia sclerotiorum (strain ATCC 18683 / 1980 / Ss-1) TaxID=665079 RepID=A7F9B0_SCLS1|nr:predicted protein [Sclerotinia sclerotiorum 1980 UF-70]EDO00321.1 predicted protein [Sclerotinia sclerotiorum 1980 UF-70]
MASLHVESKTQIPYFLEAAETNQGGNNSAGWSLRLEQAEKYEVQEAMSTWLVFNTS